MARTVRRLSDHRQRLHATFCPHTGGGDAFIAHAGDVERREVPQLAPTQLAPYGACAPISTACWNVGRLIHSISGCVIAPIARNWIESEHIWLPALQTPSAGYTCCADSPIAWLSEVSSAARQRARTYGSCSTAARSVTSALKPACVRHTGCGNG